MIANHAGTLSRLGDALRPNHAPQRRLRWTALGLGSLACLVGLTIVLPPRLFLLWNVSASAPVGLYAVSGRGEIAVGDMVAARVPEHWRRLAGERRYIPINVPLVKRVAAEPGDSVCALEDEIFVNGRRVAERRGADGRGRPMPWWSGCVTLRQGALFLLMDSSDSFDGRYFGPTSRRDIIGEARLLWAS